MPVVHVCLHVCAFVLVERVWGGEHPSDSVMGGVRE